MREEDVGTYQMLWDCPACETKGLLGLDHKHCPNCGSAQDPNYRYFPPEGTEVSAENHPYHGADIACPACETPNSANANNCISCGSPLGEGKEVRKRADQATAYGSSAFQDDDAKQAKQEFKAQKKAERDAKRGVPPPPPPKPAGMSTGMKIGIAAGAVFLFIVFLVVLFSWSKDVPIQAKGHEWTRTIAVQTKKRVSETAWRDQVPSRAYGTSCKKAVRSHKKVKDGETCRTVRKDRGNGTFKKVKKCKPKYRKEPVYDQKCRYQIEKWKTTRTEKAHGTSLQPGPSWPSVRLSRTGSCLGCERQGPKNEKYEVVFTNMESNETMKCSMPMNKWQTITVGSEWIGEAGMVTGNLDCDDLRPKP